MRFFERALGMAVEWGIRKFAPVHCLTNVFLRQANKHEKGKARRD